MANSNKINVSELNGTNGFKIEGSSSSKMIIDLAGDVNGDGIQDLVIGSPYNNNYAGEVTVVFGGTDIASSGSLNTASLNGNNGFVIKGQNLGGPGGIQELGADVSGAGDLNNDGVDDLIINSSNDFHYVVFGQQGGGFNPEFPLILLMAVMDLKSRLPPRITT